MSDNSVLPVAVGTETFANNDIGGVKYPRVKLTWGAAGVSGDVSAGNPLPVTFSGSITVAGPLAVTQSGVWTVGVSGTVAAVQSGAWTVAAAQSGAWTVAVSGSVPVTQSGAWTVGATQSGVWTVAVSGTTTVSGTVAISSGAMSITQGGNTAVVKAGSVAPVAADQALVVAMSPNSQNPNGFTTELLSSPVVITNVAHSVPAIAGGSTYKGCSASTTTQLGATGAIGDYIEGINCIVTTPATSQVQLQDGVSGAFIVFPNNPGGGICTYPVPLGYKAVGAGWKVICGAGVTVIASGTFT
jgi:hypothetical protein